MHSDHSIIQSSPLRTLSATNYTPLVCLISPKQTTMTSVHILTSLHFSYLMMLISYGHISRT